jgi:hypothetical protein
MSARDYLHSKFVATIALNVAVAISCFPAQAAVDSAAAIGETGEIVAVAEPSKRVSNLVEPSVEQPAAHPAAIRPAVLTMVSVNGPDAAGSALLVAPGNTKLLTPVATASFSAGSAGLGASGISIGRPIALDGHLAILIVLVFALVLFRRRLR